MADMEKRVPNDSKKVFDDTPENSRLFILCGRELTEEHLKDAFEAFGTVEKVDIHRDRKGDSKGIAYVKFSRTSEAAEAVEELDGRCIANHPRPLKVLIANARDKEMSRHIKEDERYLRLFVMISKDLKESELKDYFTRFGDVQYVNIIKDRETHISKGYAYVKYYRLKHAAKAFEACDRSYKPVFADPRPLRDSVVPHSGIMRTYGDHNKKENMSLLVICSVLVNEDQLWRLFDLIPGLDYCEVNHVDHSHKRSIASVVYTNPNSASVAAHKLHGFEYPPGERLIVKINNINYNFHNLYAQQNALHRHDPHHSSSRDLQTLASSIAQATSMIKTANINNNRPRFSYDPSFCSITLPPPQPLAPSDSNIAERLFLVCTPSTPPIYAVRDVFSRFGDLLDLYFLSGKRCGYALFSNVQSANDALSSLNGQEICGIRIKVMLAEPNKTNLD